MKPKRVKKTLADGTTKIYEYEREGDFFPTATKPHDGFVYFIQADSGPIKIGFTRDLRQRISSLEGHERLRLLAAFDGGRKLEKRLHRLFRPHRKRGEWFWPHAHIFREIMALAEDACRGAESRGQPDPETDVDNLGQPAKITA